MLRRHSKLSSRAPFIKRKAFTKKLSFTLGVILAIILLLTVPPSLFPFQNAASRGLDDEKLIILDPGHGGADPGAIGINDCEEKDINLKISLFLRDMLIANGYSVIMTREEDISIHDSKYKKIASQKVSDIKNRLAIMNEHPDTTVILIHQNEFGEEKYHDAQMFYGVKNENSKQLAEVLQESFKSRLQPENTRQIKRGTTSVYLLRQAQNPIVLAECGFLSNYSEAELLCDEEYQKKAAFALFCGIVEYENE